MEKIIQLYIQDQKVQIPEATKLNLKNLFSGCRVNFLLGAGFSANILKPLSNSEILFEALKRYKTKDDVDHYKIKALSAYLYWSFFLNSIKPITSNLDIKNESFTPFKVFGDILYKIFLERGNPALDRQFSIFTTNYDPILELIFDQSPCICNDGFEGRIYPIFSTDNYSKTYYRQAIFSNRKAEIPSCNLIKLHGSITWRPGTDSNQITYQGYESAINNFHANFISLFNEDILDDIDNKFTASSYEEAQEQIKSFLSNNSLDHPMDQFHDFLNKYHNSFLIINPTKEKFSDTLLNKNYYELLRIFSNELEKENTLLVVFGFSFRDEHILDIVKRSMVNPSLKILIFTYKADQIDSYEDLFQTPKNNNITFITLKNAKLTLSYLNQILSHIHL